MRSHGSHQDKTKDAKIRVSFSYLSYCKFRHAFLKLPLQVPTMAGEKGKKTDVYAKQTTN